MYCCVCVCDTKSDSELCWIPLSSGKSLEWRFVEKERSGEEPGPRGGAATVVSAEIYMPCGGRVASWLASMLTYEQR